MNRKMTFILILVLGFVASNVFAQTLTDASARRKMSSVGISVNALQPQTSLEGIREATLLELVWLVSKVPSGSIVITGGTESGHTSGTYSHANGYKVDLRLNSTLDSYIENNFRRDGSVDGYPAYRSPNGGLYVKEGNHWDVTVK